MSSDCSHLFAFAAIALAHCVTPGFASAEPKDVSETAAAASTTAPAMTMETFLDRLMMAESGGNVFANNPRSTALGPYQFIAATWLEIVNASFADKTAKLKPNEILDLRTEPVFARQVATAYSQSNAAYLVANGAKATFANLRLAFLVGPRGAARVLAAKPETPVATLLGPVVINANPFMSGMTAAGLISRAERDIAAEPGSLPVSIQAPRPSRLRRGALLRRRRSRLRAISSGRAAGAGSRSQRDGRHGASRQVEIRPIENIRKWISQTRPPPRLRHAGRRIC